MLGLIDSSRRLMPDQKNIRRSFLTQLLLALRHVWPVLSLLILFIAGVGALIAVLEGWPLATGVYFGFVTAVTIGYGDFAPQLGVTRILAVMLGFVGILMTGLFAAVGVFAMQRAASHARLENK